MDDDGAYPHDYGNPHMDFERFWPSKIIQVEEVKYEDL